MSKSTRITIPNSPASSDTDNSDDALDVDELDKRSRKLTKLLKKNINKAVSRKSILDNIRERAWLLEDQAKNLEYQASNLKQKLRQRTFRRRVVIGAIALASFGSVYYIWHHNEQ